MRYEAYPLTHSRKRWQVQNQPSFSEYLRLSKQSLSAISKIKLEKLNIPTACTVLLIFSISFGVIFSTAPKAHATTLPDPNGQSVIYISTYGQPENEVKAAWEVANSLEASFKNSGYNVTNAFGEDTTENNILSWTASIDKNSFRVATFEFGHGGYGNIIDNNGVEVYYDEVANHTLPGKNFFVFIWVCFQADDPHSGMPVAWTQNYNLSEDGYMRPDSGSSCFISFNDASPGLGSNSYQNYTVLGKDVIMEFYHYALDEGYSVNEALDKMCLDLFSTDFRNSPLNKGYNTFWPDNPVFPDIPSGWYEGRMRIFGNGNIYLSQKHLTLIAQDQDNDILTGKQVTVDISNNIASTGSTIPITKGNHTLTANDFWEPNTWNRYTLKSYKVGSEQTNSNSLTLNIKSDMTITAQYSKTYAPGDINGDKTANLTDWLTFLQHYPSATGDLNYDSRCDVNADGKIDEQDKIILLSILGSPVTFLAMDQNGTSIIDAKVYVDGKLIGSTGSTFLIPQGNHAISFKDFWVPSQNNSVYGDLYTLQYYTQNNTTYKERTTVLHFDSNTTIMSYFKKTYDLKPSIVDFPLEMSVILSILVIVGVVFILVAYKKKAFKLQRNN
jgi:hypothetical protein